jgi:hypothetical protein
MVLVMVGVTKGFKLKNGEIVPIYARGMTKSEYVQSISDPEKVKSNVKKWRKENRAYYNSYMKEYMRKRKQQKR